jgi:hypothetical protein
MSLTWRMVFVTITTSRASFSAKAGTLSQFTASAMRKEMHWALTTGALLALVLHQPWLAQPVVVETFPAAQDVFQGLLLPGLIERVERSE